MTPLHALAIAGAGFAAGMINTIVGSGSLISFPTLLGVGYAPVLANVSNTVGLIPGYVSGAYGYRRELCGQGRRVLTLLPATLAGGGLGAALLLVLPPGVFRRVVPVLLLIAVVLVAIQPRVARRLATRQRDRSRPGPLLHAGVFATGVYGGYFGAAQSVMLLALLAMFLDEDLQRLNAVKNVLTGGNSIIASAIFLAATRVAWAAVGLLFVGATVGGELGALVGRRLPPTVLRAVIVLVGTAVAIELLVTG